MVFLAVANEREKFARSANPFWGSRPAENKSAHTRIQANMNRKFRKYLSKMNCLQGLFEGIFDVAPPKLRRRQDCLGATCDGDAKRKLCGIRSSRFSPMRLPSVTERRFPIKTDAGTLLYPGLDCLRESALQSASRLSFLSLGDFLNNLAPPNPVLQLQFQEKAAKRFLSAATTQGGLRHPQRRKHRTA